MSCPFCSAQEDGSPCASIVDYDCGTRYDDVEGGYCRSNTCITRQLANIEAKIEKIMQGTSAEDIDGHI